MNWERYLQHDLLRGRTNFRSNRVSHFMRLSQIYISTDTKAVLQAIADARKTHDERVTADQVADELLQETIAQKYPSAQSFFDQMRELRKDLSKALSEGKTDAR